MAATQTKETALEVAGFIDSFVDSEQKEVASRRLIELMSGWSGFDPKIWGASIIGFGSCHYRYESGHEGDIPLWDFRLGSGVFALYSLIPEQEKLLGSLGKFKIGNACIYIKKLSDINILEAISNSTVAYLNQHHECACREHSGAKVWQPDIDLMVPGPLPAKSLFGIWFHYP